MWRCELETRGVSRVLGSLVREIEKAAFASPLSNGLALALTRSRSSRLTLQTLARSHTLSLAHSYLTAPVLHHLPAPSSSAAPCCSSAP